MVRRLQASAGEMLILIVFKIGFPKLVPNLENLFSTRFTTDYTKAYFYRLGLQTKKDLG